MDLAALKAELKVWERAFKAQHGREPGKGDIKAAPEMGEESTRQGRRNKGESLKMAHPCFSREVQGVQ